MQEPDDITLLQQYAADNSEPAFAALVARHVNLVYSTALRSVGNAHGAEEVSQAVFIILAKKAGSLSGGTSLSGWLHQTTRLTAANYLRTEIRRANREQEAYMQSLSNEPDTRTWAQIAPLLDDALDKLSRADRDALVLRYFENKSAREMALILRVGPSAAQKRVTRAVERLRTFFAKRGVKLPAAIIAGAISAHSVHAAPVTLAKTISAAAVARGAMAGGPTATLIKTTLKIMAWTKAKTVIVAGAGLLLAGATATVTVREIQEHTSEDSWRFANINSDTVARLPPEVKILPTIFPGSGNLSQGSGPNADKFVGIGQPVVNIVWAAYNWPQSRVIFAGGEPPGSYDFITTLAQGSRAALRQELKAKWGLVGRTETRDMDVLLLKMRNTNAPGLLPATHGGYSFLKHDGNHVEIKWASETLARLCELLESSSPMPIIDQSGLTNNYSIDINWEDDGKDSQHQALQQVLLDQLGLELVPGRQPVEMLVVEKAN